jgi:archaellum component FlaF (FlaF/FlaG flagellin family)
MLSIHYQIFRIVLNKLLLLIILTANGFLSQWQQYYNKTQHTNNTYKKNNTKIKLNSTQNNSYNKHPTQNEYNNHNYTMSSQKKNIYFRRVTTDISRYGAFVSSVGLFQ